MLPVEKVADLRLEHASGATETRGVEAASGLAIVGGRVYVIADDEAYLAVFGAMGSERGKTFPLLDVDIPTDDSQRKEHKPDLESLTPLSSFDRFAHGGILALGSGSGPGRHRGAFAVLTKDGDVDSVVQLDAGPLIEELAARIPKLNLEGTAVAADTLRVLQRGNDPEAFNAHIDLDLDALRDAIAANRPLGADLVTDIRQHGLGQLRGTTLCFSDADTLPDGRIVFSASAEAEGAGPDGQIGGSAVGVMSVEGEILSLQPIEVETKVEGLAALANDGVIHAYMVSDDDDPDNPSALLRTSIPQAMQ